MNEMDKLVNHIKENEKQLNFLINNAGAAWGASFDEFPENGWDKVMDTNVKSVFFLTQKLAKILEQSEKNKADILTTEKDSVRLLGYKEVSFKNKLLLKSNIVNLNVKADAEIILNDIEDSLNLSKI